MVLKEIVPSVDAALEKGDLEEIKSLQSKLLEYRAQRFLSSKNDILLDTQLKRLKERIMRK